MIRVGAAPESHYGWLTERSGYQPAPDFRAVEATDGDRILAMIGYDHFSPNGVQMHVAIESPTAIRSLPWAAFHYPFIQLGLGVVFGLVAADNARCMSLARRLGFRETHRIRDGYAPGVDVVIFEMRREECRWLKEANA